MWRRNKRNQNEDSSGGDAPPVLPSDNDSLFTTDDRGSIVSEIYTASDGGSRRNEDRFQRLVREEEQKIASEYGIPLDNGSVEGSRRTGLGSIIRGSAFGTPKRNNATRVTIPMDDNQSFQDGSYFTDESMSLRALQLPAQESQATSRSRNLYENLARRLNNSAKLERIIIALIVILLVAIAVAVSGWAVERRRSNRANSGSTTDRATGGEFPGIPTPSPIELQPPVMNAVPTFFPNDNAPVPTEVAPESPVAPTMVVPNVTQAPKDVDSEEEPTIVSSEPTVSPSSSPFQFPSASPIAPTGASSSVFPTMIPSSSLSGSPTSTESNTPSLEVSEEPSLESSATPTSFPSRPPQPLASEQPSMEPKDPSASPSEAPCFDTDRGFFVNDSVGVQKCSYLGTDPEARQELCMQDRLGFLYCPKTCGSCGIAPPVTPLFPSPAASPIWEPTSVPSAWNDEICGVDSDKVFFINEDVGMRGCRFLILNEGTRNRMCRPNMDGYRFCRKTCGNCSPPDSDTTTESPMVAPTTESPVATPLTTESPVAPPTECRDSLIARIFVDQDQGSRSCAWLADNPTYQSRLCQRDMPAREFCPVTCGVCPNSPVAAPLTDAPTPQPVPPPENPVCRDSVVALIFVDEERGSRSCRWLRNEASFQERMCRTNEPARTFCPVACGLCEENEELSPSQEQRSGRNTAIEEFLRLRINGLALGSPESPQSRALEWIVQQEDGSYLQDWILDRYALATLAFATNVEEWDLNQGWLDLSIDHCDWQKIGCNSFSRVESISLPFNKLDGEVPPELSLLADLTVLDLGRNNLVGAIPSSIGQLSSLRDLILSRNDLDGLLPSSIGDLSSLELLDVSFNQLAGFPPTSLASMDSLDSLYLQVNNFAGQVPLGLCTFIQVLEADCNKVECLCCTSCWRS